MQKFGVFFLKIYPLKRRNLISKIDIKVELEKLESAQNKAREETIENNEEKVEVEYISIDDFSKMELKVGEVIKCEKVEKADKLLKSQIKIGNEIRQIVSGIAKYYSRKKW